VAYEKYFHTPEWKYDGPRFHVGSFVLNLNMSMKNSQFFFKISRRKLIEKYKKKETLYNLGMFKKFVKCIKKAKKAVELVEVYVPRKFSEDSTT